jgi:hypothetical protein
VRTDIEKALKGAPHALGVAEAALLGDGLDRQSALFEFAAGRIGPRPFGKLRRRMPGFAAKEPGEIARAHAHAIRQGGYAEILPRMPQDPGLQFLYLWPAPHFQVFHIGAELGLPPGAAGENLDRTVKGHQDRRAFSGLDDRVAAEARFFIGAPGARVVHVWVNGHDRRSLRGLAHPTTALTL